MFSRYVRRRMKEGILLFLICATIVFVGCGISSEKRVLEEKSQDKEESYSEDIFAMDTYMTLTAYGTNAKEAIEKAKEEIRRVENLVSTGISSSEVFLLNEKGEGVISEDTQILLSKSIELYKSTNGVFDITVYPVMKLWGFADQNYKVPSKKELEIALRKMGSDQIQIKEEGEYWNVVYEKKGMEIDFGGIAKGYTSQRVIDIFREEGIESAVISLGGNVHTLGRKTDRSRWKVAIENPDTSKDYLGIVSVEDKAVITSGGYERYFEENGKTYHHIIDPATGYPAENGLSSVTIVSENGTLADGLSTSLYIMGKEKSIQYWKNYGEEFDAILVEDDGTISITEGIRDDFTSENIFDVITN